MSRLVFAVLVAVTGSAGAVERYPSTPVPGMVQPVVFDVFGQSAAHPNCNFGAPCCCVSGSTDSGFCTGTQACKDSNGTCTGDSSKCPNG